MYKPIQIVDINGAHIGLAKSPNEAKQKALVRAISRVTISDSKGEKYLLQKRAEDMDVWPGRWDNSAAGHVDENETPEQAAYRELAEEIGLTNIKLVFSRTQYYEHPKELDGSQNRMYNYFYAGVFEGNASELKLDPSEVSEVRWFTLDEVLELIKKKPSAVTDGVVLTFRPLL